jgi:vacuolar protein sorting-associated protein 54
MDAAVDREHVWTTRDIGTNSISGIMKDNNSLLKTLENITLNPLGNSTNIRKVRLEECDDYLALIKKEHDKFLLNRVVGLSATEGIPDLVSVEAGDTFHSLEEWTARLAMAGSFVANQLPPLRSNSKSPRKDKNATKPKMHSGNVPPLDTVPGIYLDENFNLGNPHTFSAVCEYLDVTGSNADSFTTQKILQEKLSDYLDVVEIHLMKEISTKSSGFFSALENLQILHSETKSCITRISDLQEKLDLLSNNHVKKGLEIVKLKRERGNYDLLLEGKTL